MELRPAVSKMKGEDTRGDFFLLNGMLEEGSVIETGNDRESQAKEPRMYE